MRRVAALAVLVTVAAACTSAPPAPAPVVLRVVMADDWASAPVVAEVIETFEREHNGRVKVQLQGAPFSQIPDVVATGTELDQPPDLAHWHAFAAGAAGIAQPIDDLWDASSLRADEFLAGAYADVVWDGRIYGLPLDVNALVLLANTQLLEEADLATTDLADLAGFRTVAATLVERSSVDYAITMSASSWTTYGWIVANGGRLMEVDGRGLPLLDAAGQPTFTFEDPAVIETLDLLAGLVASGHAPSPFAPDLALDSVASFSTGEVGLHASGSWDLPLSRHTPSVEQLVDEVTVLPLPQADSATTRTVLGGSSLFVPVGAANRELAFELAHALVEDDVALRLAVEEGRLPARVRVYDDPVFSSSPDLAVFVGQLPHAEIMPLIAYPEVAAAFRDALEAVFGLRMSAAEAMARLQAHAERVTGE